jgi:hypothetical protein
VPKPAESQSTARSQAQRQKAEASFGTRRKGFVPGSSAGDEPSNNNFTTKLHTSLFDDASSTASSQRTRQESSNLDPLSRQFRGTFLDPRLSTPYQTHGGEKTNPFDGVNLSRAKSVRGDFRKFDSSHADLPTSPLSRQRSASVPDESENIKQAMKDKGGFNDGSVPSRSNFKSAPGEQHGPQTAPNSAPTSAWFTTPNSSSSSVHSVNGR